MSDGTPGQDLPVGFGFRPYRGEEDHSAMAAVRLGCAERDGVDAHSVVEGLPTAAEIAEASAALEEPSRNQILVVCDGMVVGYATIRWWQERDDTWLYLHRGHLLPEHRHQGIGSAMLSWAEERIRRLVTQHGTTRTAVIGANAVASAQDATTLLLTAGYRRVLSLVELELGDLRQLPERGSELPTGIWTGPIGASHYRAAWRTVVDSYADTGLTQKWPFRDFVDTAHPACWRAAWKGQDMVGVALCSIRRHDRTVGEVEELSIRADQRRLGIGRALLLDGLRSLREQGATAARLFTGTANPHRSFDLYESVGFRRQNEYVRYRKPLA
ncbi:GNAT family N-acetyltransferase [Streptomyces broussonetiae]|uniref:GNAT family N-acetyltransferase n=1 Tax=Streptomyces broussonetiae TaxID=2686304 RepID=A0A6I6NFA7_9ACTN|nr:GNAT family N-acetyltransferase [Streptomyces broussonetiae]QHA09021.1 GNAT family N-acetyltransferase [Streptomyces broussonetiae]